MVLTVQRNSGQIILWMHDFLTKARDPDTHARWISRIDWAGTSLPDPLFTVIIYEFALKVHALDRFRNIDTLIFALCKIPVGHCNIRNHLCTLLVDTIIDMFDETEIQKFLESDRIDAGCKSFENCQQVVPTLSFREWAKIVCRKIPSDSLVNFVVQHGYKNTFCPNLTQMSISNQTTTVVDLSVRQKGDILMRSSQSIGCTASKGIRFQFAELTEADCINVFDEKTNLFYLVLTADRTELGDVITVAPWRIACTAECFKLLWKEMEPCVTQNDEVKVLEKINLQKYCDIPSFVLFLMRICAFKACSCTNSFIGDILQQNKGFFLKPFERKSSS